MACDESKFVEYQAAQDSAQFADGLVWTSTGITWGLTLVLLGLTAGNTGVIRATSFSVIGIFLVVFQWQVQHGLRSIKNQKYRRCKELETALGMTQHTTLIYTTGSQTLVYRALSFSMVVAWLAVLYTSWTGSK